MWFGNAQEVLEYYCCFVFGFGMKDLHGRKIALGFERVPIVFNHEEGMKTVLVFGFLFLVDQKVNYE